MRTLFVLIVLFSLVIPSCLAAQPAMASGRAVGEVTPSFPVLDVTGPHKGKSICYVCESKDAPTILAFFREPGHETANMVKKLEELARQRPEVKVIAILIEGPDQQPWLEQLAQGNDITIPLTVLRKGKDDVAMKVYKLNPSADNTVLLNVKRKVAANFVNVTAETFSTLPESVSRVLGQR